MKDCDIGVVETWTRSRSAPWRVRIGLLLMRGYTNRAFTVARHMALENQRLVGLLQVNGIDPYVKEAKE